MLAIAEFGTGVRAHHQSLGLGQRLVRGEAVVDVYAAFIRNDVRAFAAGDQRGVEALAIIEPVHVHGGRLVGVESVQNVGRLVDGVLPHPCTGGVRGHGHDAAGFHVSGFFPRKEHIAAYLIAEGGVVHGRIHGREAGRRQPLPDFGKGRAAFFFGLHPFGDGKDDAFVPVFPQDGPCVDVIVQVPVVKGDQ